jgi:uncharacterized protein YecT (DUF1311 family)
MNTDTPLSNTSTLQIIEVTRIVRIEQTIVVTATRMPAFAQDCLNNAITQIELTSCAALEAQLAKAEMERIISQIKYSSEEEKQEFNQLQSEWELQIVKDCEFLFAQIITDDKGNLFYKGGSMAPMQRNFCIAEQYKRRTEDLKFAYFAK